MKPDTVFLKSVERYSILALIWFLATMSVGLLLSPGNSQYAPSQRLLSDLHQTDRMLFSYILTRNVHSFFLEVSSLVTAGLASLLFLMTSGLQLGFLIRHTDLKTVFIFVAPHGLLEMSVFIINAGTTFAAIETLVRCICEGYFPQRRTLWTYFILLVVLLVGLVGAAAIEAFVTPALAALSLRS